MKQSKDVTGSIGHMEKKSKEKSLRELKEDGEISNRVYNAIMRHY